jgi:hypothetical protein
MKYRKKPVEVEAMWYDGSMASFDSIWKWMGGDDGPNQGYKGSADRPGCFDIKTLEGELAAYPGDWIIKGVAGEFYPCRRDIFELTYDEVK